MFYKTLKFIAIISVILYFSAFCYLRLKHPFWFSQPVTQYTDLFKIEGIITENIPKPIIINSFKVQFINTMESKNIEQIKQLLNNTYNVDESYRFNYDQKYKTITHYFDGTIKPGKHKLRLLVEDSSGNIATFEKEFIR